MQNRRLMVAACTGSLLVNSLLASDPPPPQIAITSSNGQKTVNWQPYPATDQYTVLSKTNVAGVFTNDGSGIVTISGWTATNNSPAKFFKLGVTPMSSNALLTANVLNRLAYGPTPDELARVNAIGPQAYINEQVAMNGI